MMTPGEIRAELARYSFMPGWEISIAEPWDWEEQDPVLVIRALVRDTYQPDRMIRIASTAPIRPHITREMFADFLWHVVQGAIIHEAQEWFKRDGQILRDPHARDRASV